MPPQNVTPPQHQRGNKGTATHLPEVGLSKRRWLILGIFLLLSMSNGFQWIQYVIIPEVIGKYYGVSDSWVNWTSMIYMVMYIPFVAPAAWVLHRFGLRVTTALGAFGNCAGAWVKCYSVKPESFKMTFLGQTVAGMSQLFILGSPPRLAAVWFGANEVATACAIGVFGNELGIAVGFLIPPLVVPQNATVAETTTGLKYLFFGSAAFTSVIFLMVVFCFTSSPPAPPSEAQANALASKQGEPAFRKDLCELLKSGNFLLLMFTYGLNVGAFYALSTLLGRVLIARYPGKNKEIGQIGVLIVLAGMLGAILAGLWLDKTKTFKWTAFLGQFMSFCGMLAYTLIIDLHELWLVYLVASLLGFFMTSLQPIGFEFGAEITYPISEGTVSGALNLACQVCGLLETLIMSELLEYFGAFTSNAACTCVTLFACILTLGIQQDLRRDTTESPLK